MAVAAPKPRKLAPEEYLERERQADFRSEYWHGEVFAMSGVTGRHSQIASNLHFALRLRVRAQGSKVHQSDLKVGAAKRRGFAYPDLAVVCKNAKFFDSTQDVLMNPVVVCEIPSDSTRAFDLSTKLAEYQKLDSLRHYVAVEQDRRAVYHWERSPGEKWSYEILEAPDAALRLTALKATIPLDEIYDEIALPKSPQRQRKVKP